VWHGTARHGTSDRLAMALGALKMMWGSVEMALTGFCAILLCCVPVLAGFRRGRYRSPARLLV